MNPSTLQKDAGDADFNQVSELASWLSQNQGLAQINHPARTSTGTDFSNAANYNETWIPLVEFKNKDDWHWSYYWECGDGSGCTTYTILIFFGTVCRLPGWIKYALDQGIHWVLVAEMTTILPSHLILYVIRALLCRKLESTSSLQYKEV
jgi:hypothetical protein